MAKRSKKASTQQTQEQPFDNVLKSLFEGQEAEVLPFFVPGAEYVETLNVEALRPPLRADRVYKIRKNGRYKILHLELETSSNSEMAYRLVDYHTYFLHKYHGLPVISIIIYPFQTTIATSPFIELDEDEELLKFAFRVLCLWQMDAQAFIMEHIVSLYALLPTMSGANEVLLHQAIEELATYYSYDETRLARQLRWLGILLRRAKTVSPADKRRMQERLNMWDDLMEKDPKMREIRKQSKAQGLAEGEAKGEVKGLQQAVVRIVRGRFPELSELAEKRVTQVHEAPMLYYLIEQVSVAPDEAMVRWLLRPTAA